MCVNVCNVSHFKFVGNPKSITNAFTNSYTSVNGHALFTCHWCYVGNSFSLNDHLPTSPWGKGRLKGGETVNSNK